MSNSNYNLTPVKELVKVLNGGIEFYKEAKSKVSSQSLEIIFERMISEKERAAAELQPLVVLDEGEVETDNDFMVSLRETYTKVLSVISTDKEHTYISQLEEVEDRVLEKIEAALEEPLPAPYFSTLKLIQNSMQACHDEMKALQEVTA
ncbi:PA2169 family four-helix-bundle protein [Pseudoalteromonas sp. MMG024]|uniref:ferritin-like domain-containing protein n=1 Tax=Pseudoalteromonas sp. MMG024 TaxID=2909980 RepID=UPI001F3371D2|nr:PA2169 family four-helix-bundle protein [Pseudoalteromonas sp. MMG024]MCF6458852.1 PA2169 family four-helix-bundle protein [Pseudoalteromonas sp. MMG024]